MITPQHAQLMARYNRWQNQNAYDAAASLAEPERRRDCGLFFGSIHATLNHILWGDQLWLSRFDTLIPPPPAPELSGSIGQYDDWSALRGEREAFDQTLIDWAARLDQDWLNGDLHYQSTAVQREYVKPRWLLVTHLFNHQTHHRGQVHAALTQAGVKTNDTDIPFMP